MKNLIQKYFMAIVAVMMVVGFSAFKLTEKHNDEEWFNVELKNPSLPATSDNLKIIDVATNPPAVGPGDFCALLNTTDTCMARIDVTNLIANEIPLETLHELTLEEAEDWYFAPVAPGSSDDGYARRNEAP